MSPACARCASPMDGEAYCPKCESCQHCGCCPCYKVGCDWCPEGGIREGESRDAYFERVMAAREGDDADQPESGE